MEEDYFWTLVSRYFSSEASEEEKQALAEILAKNEDRRQQWEYAKQQWKYAPELPRHDRTRTKQLLVQGLARSRQQEVKREVERASLRKRRQGRWLRWSAACLLLGLSALVYFRIEREKSVIEPALSVKTVQVPDGTVQKVLLPDGTKVWLNAGSTLRYTKPFRRGMYSLSARASLTWSGMSLPPSP